MAGTDSAPKIMYICQSILLSTAIIALWKLIEKTAVTILFIAKAYALPSKWREHIIRSRPTKLKSRKPQRKAFRKAKARDYIFTERMKMPQQAEERTRVNLPTQIVPTLSVR
jgi:hypothetical protein